MKRLICLTLVVIILFCTASCKKKVYLEPGEYYVYQSGNLVEDFFGEDSYQYRFSEIQNDMLRDWCPETKRGIKIGSSVSEIAKAYNGVGFYFPVLGDPYANENTNIGRSNYFTRYSKITSRSFGDRYYNQAELYERGDGVYFPDEETIIITYVTSIYKGEIRDDINLIKFRMRQWPDVSYSFIEYEGNEKPFNSSIYSIIIEIDKNYKVSDIIIEKVEF